MLEENIVKLTCKELGLTQKDLADTLGVSKPSVERWAQSGDIPDQAKKQLELLVENSKIKNELNELKSALNILSKYSK
jgi:transcriptional regulator with XRE-family HTH domain